MNSDKKIIPPIAEKRITREHYHGQELIDNYNWIRDENWQEVLHSPSILKKEIRDYIDKENKRPSSKDKNPEIKKGMLRGYGGKKVDYYDINITDEDMLPALKKMALINNHFKLSIIEANSN